MPGLQLAPGSCVNRAFLVRIPSLDLPGESPRANPPYLDRMVHLLPLFETLGPTQLRAIAALIEGSGDPDDVLGLFDCLKVGLRDSNAAAMEVLTRMARGDRAVAGPGDAER